MPTYICDKLSKGKLKFEIDWINRQLRLLEDFPESDGSGAFFSHEWVNFDIINKYLSQNGHGGKFLMCFKKNLSNNAPMLSAILLAFKCIDKDYNYLRYLNEQLENDDNIKCFLI